MRTGRQRGGFVEMVRRANQSPPPENSVLFRLATLVSVLAGVLACSAVGEITAATAISASSAIGLGMLFSFATRRRSHGIVKIILACAVLAVFVSFVTQVFSAARTGELSSIEVPLAGLFTWVQVVHSFDVPARRDLLFSLAASAALVTVAAAQAISPGFALFVGTWFVATTTALACSWRSMAGGRGRLPAVRLTALSLVVIVLALALETLLPAPRASQTITLPNSVTTPLSLPPGTSLTEGGSLPTEPAKAGSPAGPVRVGGYLGFAGPLDTGIRAALSNQVVMRVRADRPGYFLGMTYNRWDGQSWTTQSHGCRSTTLTNGPFEVSPGVAGGTTNVQTFYVATTLPNLLFATSVPETVYFPDKRLILGCDGSMRSAIAMTPGTVYTVVSQDNEAPLSVLLADHIPASSDPSIIRQANLELPYPYPKAEALARSIIRSRHATSSIAAEVDALEWWMSTHTHYSTDIPPLPRGVDAVNSFLFGSRVGYCEQISTALTVMLRSLGIPAREAIGYVPGSFNPLTDLYTIEAKDAHAWVQVYIPGHGWQNFDPTANVPLEPADPGAVLLTDIGHQLARLPWAPLGSVIGLGAAGFGTNAWRRRRRRMPRGWAARAAGRLEAIGRAAGCPRLGSETLNEYAARLSVRLRFEEGAEVQGTALLEHAVSLIVTEAYGCRPSGDSSAIEVAANLRQLRGLLNRGPNGALLRSWRPGRAANGTA